MSAQTPFLVFSGTNSRYLAEKICNSLGCPLGQMNIQHFADGEFSVSYEESIRGKDVFLVQSTFPNADNLMELLLMIDAAKRAFDGVVNSLEWQGEDIQIGHVCIGTGVGSYQFYCDRPCVTNDLHGVGAFLLMCTELQVAENVCAQNR